MTRIGGISPIFFPRYDDIYSFAVLEGGSGRAKVCSERDGFCCLAEWSAEFGQDVFALGAFSGDHYRDGSVLGRFNMQMCSGRRFYHLSPYIAGIAVMKCDPRNSTWSCRQDLLTDYEYLSTSDAAFTELRLAATFKPGVAVYPEVLFRDPTPTSSH